MKKLLSVICIAASAVAAFGTAQLPESINDCGHEKNMASRLLELDSVSFSRLKERISDKMVSTDLWRGYIGHWEIKNDSLFLDSILVSDNASDTRRFMPAAIDDIYASHRTPSGYFADWVSDTIRVVSGNIVRDRHMGWSSDWETEEMIAIEGGLIKGRIIYNYRIINQVDENEARMTIDSLDFGNIPQRMLLQIGYQEFDKTGTPTVCKVDIVRGSGDTAVDNRVARALDDVSVMRKLVPIYYIRGQYKSDNCNLVIPKKTYAEEAAK